jgi:hypothetical protein
MIKQVKIQGKEYPFRVTMGALLRFKRLTGRDASTITDEDLEGLIALFYCCIASACNADGVEWPYSLTMFEDILTEDEVKEMTKLMARENPEDSKKKEPKSSR